MTTEQSYNLVFLIAENSGAATSLQEVGLPIVSSQDCARAYNGNPNRYIENFHVCAGFPQGGRDACQGKIEFLDYIFFRIALVNQRPFCVIQ